MPLRETEHSLLPCVHWTPDSGRCQALCLFASLWRGSDHCRHPKGWLNGCGRSVVATHQLDLDRGELIGTHISWSCAAKTRIRFVVADRHAKVDGRQATPEGG